MMYKEESRASLVRNIIFNFKLKNVFIKLFFQQSIEAYFDYK